MEDKRNRIAIVDADKCKPNKCNQECKKICPVNLSGKLCIDVSRTSKVAAIAEPLCFGCTLCVKRCPFEAIKIVNLPTALSDEVSHRYGPNSFKLHRLPVPKPGEVLGLVGTNGIGKSTALRIIAGKLAPNFGNYENPPPTSDIIKNFRGSGLQKYFKNLEKKDFRAVIKEQYVDADIFGWKGKVKDIIAKTDQKQASEEFLDILELRHLLERDVKELSGGEMQRLAILVTSMQKATMYMFDEPSSFLDVKQRLTAANYIRSLLTDENYVIAIEHDLTILDYMSDQICCLYGMPSVYGVVTKPSTVREGINHFLDGYLPSENVRFRDEPITFKINDKLDDIELDQTSLYKYPEMTKKLGDFQLKINPGKFSSSQIVVMLGENGTGKTTFIKMLAGVDEEKHPDIPEMAVSYKPQKLNPKFEGTVRELFEAKLKDRYLFEAFQRDVYRPLQLDALINNNVKELSGGELQRVAIALALGKPANVYLLDEPSAYLDCEQRLTVAKIIKRFILNAKKTAFIVEHDFIMATYLADNVIVFEGEPGRSCIANSPQSLVEGMNKFLGLMNITFRRDPTNFRPRINKLNSKKDTEQKISGNYFCMDN